MKKKDCIVLDYGQLGKIINDFINIHGKYWSSSIKFNDNNNLIIDLGVNKNTNFMKKWENTFLEIKNLN